jgi:mannosyltransferase
MALCLRAYRLDGQSLWADEGNSAALAARSLATITQDAARDIHPPLYYYILHFWVRILGDSEVALRSLSVFAGTALVFVTYRLGGELFNRRVALIASFLAAISPLQIHYSQETRMYILASLWSGLAVLFFLRVVKSWGAVGLARQARPNQGASRARRVLYVSLYIVFTTAALYTHYFTFTVPLVTNLAYGLGMIVYRSLRRPLVIATWIAAQVAIVALYYPWLVLAGGQLTAWPAVSEPFGFYYLVGDLLRVFTLGLTVEQEITPVLLGLGLLLLLGALPWQFALTKGRRPGLPSVVLLRPHLHSVVFVLVYLGVPILAMYVLSLTRPAYDPKFLLLVTPAFSLILARGVAGEWLGAKDRTGLQGRISYEEGDTDWRRVANIVRFSVTGVTLFMVTVASAQSLANYYFDEEYARDDYRGIVHYITAAGREGDAIILNAPGQIDVFSYYYKGPLPVYPLPGQRPLDEVKTEEALRNIVAKHERLFVLLWGTDESDPERFIEGWLDRGSFKSLDSWQGNVRLAIYAMPQEEISSEIQHPAELRLGEKIAFLGYSVSSSEIAAGDILQLTLFWQALDEMGERYKVFTHVLDTRSHIVGQRDAEPVGGARPTSTWEEGENIADNYGVLVLPGTPPGEHHLEIGMYSLETGQRLPVFEDGELIGDRILLQPVRVVKAAAPPLVEALGMQQRRDVGYGPLRLLGYDVHKLGYRHQPNEALHPGDILHTTLYWQAVGKIETDFSLSLRLVDQNGLAVVSREVRPAGGTYPPTLWEDGEIVRDQHNLLLPAELPPGRYDFLLRIRGLGVETAPLLLKSLRI